MQQGYGPIANQRITGSSVVVRLASGDYKDLQNGTLVKYIAKPNLPDHCAEAFGSYDEDYEVACFTPFGIGLIRRWSVELEVY